MDSIDIDCDQPSGYVEDDSDCDDGDADTHPGADEYCDGHDDDCDDETDEDDALDASTWYADDDSDGYGDLFTTTAACDQPTGYVPTGTDCDDSNALINPAGQELCNGDDDDCDMLTDEDDALDALTWYADADSDGYGDITTTATACSAPTGYVLDSTDCDDGDATVYPTAQEFCDGLDNDCDGAADDSCSDCNITVPSDHATIAAAYAAAASGDMICVEPGVYYENLDFDGTDVSLVGVEGAEFTIIDGGASDSVLIFDSGETTDFLVQGFTLTNGSASSSSSYGGGVYVNYASPTLSQLIISGNYASLDGGGIGGGYSSLVGTDLTITDNEAGDDGGGVRIWSSSSYSPQIHDSTIADNYASDDGGGAYFGDITVTLSNVVFTGNECGDAGGGVAPFTGAIFQAPNLGLYDNQASKGGGIFVDSGAEAYFENIVVAGNLATTESGGMGVNDSSVATLVNATIVGNESAGAGGGIAITSGSEATLDNVLITDNSAAYGGGIYFSTSATAITTTYNAVWDNSPDDYYGMSDPTGTSGNLNVDPELSDTSGASAQDWDLHLGTSSPLIDAGDPAIFDPDGSTSDIGGYGGDYADGWDRDGDGYYEWWMPGSYGSEAYDASLDCDDWDDEVYPDNGCSSCSISVPSDYSTIQNAISAAADGDTICVDAGTYYENIDFGGFEGLVLGVEGAAATTIDGGAAGSVVSFQSGEGSGAGLQGFTITNGSASDGGGIYCYDSSPMLSDLVVSSNAASSNGGGVYVEGSSAAPTLAGLEVYDNSAGSHGAGVYFNGAGAAQISSCDISANTASSYAGGVLIDTSDIYIDSTIIADNSAGYAGGIFIYAAEPQISNTRISGNSSSSYGGGVYLLGCSTSDTPLFANVALLGNDAAAYGGGAFIQSCYPEFRNSVVSGNTATAGGAFGIQGASSSYYPLFTSTIISDNSCNAGAIYNMGGYYYMFYYSDVYGNYPTDYYGMPDLTGAYGNISADPLFLDTSSSDPLDWDLHLNASSPAIDAGSTSYYDPDGSRSDMGLYGGEGAESFDLDGDGYYEWYQAGSYDSSSYPALGLDCDDQDESVYPDSGC